MRNPIACVGDVLRGIASGKSVKTLERPAIGSEFGILKISAVTWGEFRPNENKAMPSGYDPGGCPRAMAGDILISRANTRDLVGAPVLVDADYPQMLLSDKLLKLIPDDTLVDRRFLVKALSSPSVRAHFTRCAGGTSGSMTNITQGDIRSAPLPLPSLSEQRRIAALLDKAEALRAYRREAIVKLNQLVQSVFLDVFGDPVTNPKGWPTGFLAAHTSKIGSGATPRGGDNSYHVQGISFIRSLNVHDGVFRYKKLVFIDGDQAKKLSGVTVDADDVLLNITGASVARVCLVPRDVLPARVNQHVAIIRCLPSLLPAYLEQVLLSPSMKRKLLVTAGGGATREAITKMQIQGLEIPLPPVAEQQKFSTLVSKISEQLECQSIALEKQEQLFNTLQNNAFAGEI